MLSYAGNSISLVGMPYQAYQLTHSSLVVGLLSFAELVPLVGTALLGGALADAVDRRRLIRGTQLFLCGSGAALALNAVAWHQLWLLFLLAVLSTGLYGLQRPSLEALVPVLVRRDELPSKLSHGAPLRSASQLADDLGVAMQITNIVRDLHEDARHGRVYLPGEELVRITPDQLREMGSHNAHGVANSKALPPRGVRRHQVELGHMELREQHAVAAIELLIAENDVAARQLRDEVRESARLDAIDHCADSAGGGHARFSEGTSTSLMLAPLSNSLTVFSLYGRA